MAPLKTAFARVCRAPLPKSPQRRLCRRSANAISNLPTLETEARSPDGDCMVRSCRQLALPSQYPIFFFDICQLPAMAFRSALQRSAVRARLSIPLASAARSKHTVVLVRHGASAPKQQARRRILQPGCTQAGSLIAARTPPPSRARQVNRSGTWRTVSRVGPQTALS